MHLLLPLLCLLFFAPFITLSILRFCIIYTYRTIHVVYIYKGTFNICIHKVLNTEQKSILYTFIVSPIALLRFNSSVNGSKHDIWLEDIATTSVYAELTLGFICELCTSCDIISVQCVSSTICIC